MKMTASDFKNKVLPISKKAFRFATILLKDENEAKDVVQDVFLKLWQKKDELEKIENMEAFVMRITRNRCFDILRADKTMPIDNKTQLRLNQKIIDVHSNFEFSEAANQVKQLINELPEIQKTIISLRDIEQLEYEEIAELTGLQINAIRVNLSRARKKVRDAYLKLNANENNRNKKNTTKLL